MATSNHDTNRDPTPRRQVERRIKPAFCLDDCTTVQELAQRLQKRIRQTLYARGAGTVVAINSQAEVYLLMAGEARTERFYAEQYDWVMGTYAELPMGGGNAAVPDLHALEEDIRFHLPAWALDDEPAQLDQGAERPVQLQLPFPPLHEMAAAA
ncbi:hypothetical protein [Stenotrophomonas acidaminiphila]|uniref:hypothetical protein n=1 Tax=Stenotrophomonas acidaminiphila TaxID=128780 RepID=UPI0024AE776F|nr:hypothetical protein [Stenotrophomonas acidaminiphila]WHL17647.1 hypothetical protein QLF99_11250 [Stenotrophomonas acidaminiphila]